MLIMIQGTVLVAVILLVLGVFYLLDLGPETRRQQLYTHVLYGVAAAVFVSGVILWRLRPILQVLGMWDRETAPSESLLREAQMRALTYPGQFIGEAALVVLIVNAIALYAEVQFLGYEFGPELINIALTTAFSLATIFTINVGLRMLLRAAILRRIVQPPVAGQGRSSIVLQFALMTTLLGVTVLLFGGVFTYASVVNLSDQAIADERARWLQSEVLVDALTLPVEQRIEYVAQRTQAGEVPFFLDRSGQVLGSVSLPYGLQPAEVRHLASVTQPRLYSKDYSAVRVLAVPFGPEPVLGLAYRSQVSDSPLVARMLRFLALCSLGALLFAVFVGLATGSNLAIITNDVARRLVSIAEQDVSVRHTPIAQTSLDELGHLVQALNRIQKRTDDYTAQLESNVVELETANDERRALLETMVGLTAPVIPVSEGLVVVPLAGYFDTERAAHIRPNLLSGIAEQRARIVVIDLTGITKATEPLADHLTRAARSAALMGCQIVLTGAGPDVAWSLTEMGTELAALAAHRDLEEGLAYAQAQLRAN
jgi:anti-anti-sigma regulatory factor